MKKIYVGQSIIEGRGIFAGEDISAGEKIQYIAGKKTKLVSTTKEEALTIPNWFGLSRQFWIDPEETPFRYLNHSCEPNAAIRGTKTLVAMRAIKKDEEIAIDYSMTDADPLWQLACACNMPTCRKKIGSIHTVPTEVFNAHMPHIPRYFQRIYIRNYIHKGLKSTHGSDTDA